MPDAAPALILVVGMHRSGTSLLGSLLHAAGVAVPGPLISGDQHNPEGYFERADITDLQEQLLIDMNRWWPSATGMLALPANWLKRSKTEAAAQTLRRLLAEESGRQQGPWAIKDPRSSLLLPLWRQVCQELAIPLRLVLAVRDPAEVVRSLCQRDAEAAGMTADRAERLWWHHNQIVLAQASDLPLQVVSYSRWFSPDAGPSDQLRQLLQFCGLNAAAADPTAMARCLGQIKPQHRRSSTTASDQVLQTSTLELYRALVAGDMPRARRLAANAPRLSEHRAAHSPPAEQPAPRPSMKARLRAALWQRRAERAPGGPWDPGAWFDELFYRSHWPGLAACSRPALLFHYQQAGWLAGTPPHPLFDPGYYRLACEQAGLPLVGDPLAHWLDQGLDQGLAPNPLCCPLWLRQLPEAGRGLAALRLTDVHPWGAAAEALSAQQGQPEQARTLLEQWVNHGQLSSAELKALAALPSFTGNSHHPLALTAEKPAWTAWILGASWQSWPCHALLQHGPPELSSGPCSWREGVLPAAGVGESPAATVVLHLQPLDHTRAQGLLLTLAQCLVLDPNPAQVQLLRQLGVNAQLICPTAPIHHALEPETATEASASLGLPAPTALAGGPAVLCLGSAGTLWERQLDKSCWCLPGFHDLNISTPAHARQLAAWLQTCQQAGMQLVELLPPANSLPFDGFAALAQPNPAPPGWLPVQRFHAEITPAELQTELNWRRQGSPPPPPCITPSPSHRCLWQQRSQAPVAAVCVSLYNYASRIEAALQSVHSQTLDSLELIVVDDASSDGSSAVVQTWLERHGQRFARALLLQHQVNGGLASARNTAFAAAEAPWCFVLDADNQLLPEAVVQCLAVAQCAPTTAAVVHPLVALAYEQPDSYPRALLSHQSWQRECFRTGNFVDAMALVRRSAWQQVGGYTHIPGGWEDFDFWCTLIDAGLHGVLCPQRLAVYTVHGTSMAATNTRRLERPLSRLLLHRHPWLRLPLAAEAPSPSPAPPA